MQKRIQELAAGKCGSHGCALIISVRELEIEATEGKAASGSFTIESADGMAAVGQAYSSNPRMKCLTSAFRGQKARLEYEFFAEGLKDGDVQKGKFHIISDYGEYDVPFTVRILREYADSSMGKVKSIVQFANLAAHSGKEAAKVFGKPEFPNLFGGREEEERLAYEMLARRPCTVEQVEEFLIAAGKKKRADFHVEEAEREFPQMEESARQQVVLSKEEPGCISIEMASDAEWAKPVKGTVTADDFIGGRAVAEYDIDAGKLHAGKNFARLTFRTAFRTEQVQICVLRKKAARDRTKAEVRKKMVEIGRAYVSFGLRKTVTGAWAKLTGQKLDELHLLCPDNQWYLLAKAQVYLVNRQRQEGEWALKEFPKREVDKDSPLYAYFLYVKTLFEPEPSDVHKKTEEVKKIYRKNQENNLLFWILLFMDEELSYSPGRKLDAIERQLARGGESPALYLEAYRLYSMEPYLITTPGRFERKILNWAAKNHAVTKDIAERVCQLVPKIPEYHPLWYRILEACYEAYPEKEMLSAVCGYCMKWNCYGSRYFKWYQKGVEEDLKIAGIFEAWMLSAGKEQMRRIPKPVVVYFRYNKGLPYQQMALLYEAAVENRAAWKTSFPHYRRGMEEFALSQLRLGRADRQMASIYREVLEPEMITEELADSLAKILFIHEVPYSNPNARLIILRQYPLKGEQAVPLKDGKAYVSIYGGTYRIMAEDDKGNRFLPEEELHPVPLLDSEKFLERGIACAKDKIPFLVKYFDKKKIWQNFSREDLDYAQALIRSDAIRDSYREELQSQMVDYSYHNFTGDALDAFLQSVPFEGLSRDGRGKVMELLVGRRHYGRVYEILRNYGCDSISPKKLVYVISCRMEEIGDADGPDEFLLEMCHNVFLHGKYNEGILMYLCRYFHGTTEEMAGLWQAARNFMLDTYELEERCIAQFLYTGDYSADVERIFESYGEKHGRDELVLAYLTLMAHQFVTKDAVVADYVFEKIGRLMRDGQELNEACRIGYLKWCSKSEGGADFGLAERILEENIRNGAYFPFYHRLPGALAEKYMYFDTQFFEYRTKPGTKVKICYLPERRLDYVECEMDQPYEGIFVKGFCVFYGEKIPYYIKEEQGGEWVITQSGQIQGQEVCDSAQGSRYDIINDMMVSCRMSDEATLAARLRDYARKDKAVKERFHIL